MLGLGLSLWNAALGGGGGATVNPVQTNIAAWFKYGVGITEAGGLVSQWADASGNARHLLQATGTNQPTLNGSAILLDGVDNYLKCDAFTLIQPETVYLLVNQISYAAGDRLCDGDTTNGGIIYQPNTTPNTSIFAGTAAVGPVAPIIGTYNVLAAVYNGASSLIQLNNGTPVTGDAGAANLGGFTLGAAATGTTDFGHIEVKEVIIYSAAHDDATRAQVIGYLAAVGGLSI